jgi:hypothetical protein
MILSFNARDTHPRDKKVIDWYNQLYRSEKSRKIIDILYAHITDSQHTIQYEVGESLKQPRKEEVKLQMVDISTSEPDSELDLNSKLDLLGGDFE